MNLDTLNGPQLVAEHNRIARLLGLTPVNRFSSLAAARKRTAGLIAILAEQTTAAVPEITQEPIPAPAQPDPQAQAIKADPFHARNRENKQLMWDVLDALREAAGPDGSVDPKAVRAAHYPAMAPLIWAGHLRGLAMRGLYSPGRIVIEGQGEYRRPG